MSNRTYAPRYPRALQPVRAIPVHEAAHGAPTLARLAALGQQSQACLTCITPLLAPALRSGLQAGPIEEQQWCLLAANSAVAAKLRQMSPALCAHLRAKGFEVTAIRIKVQMR
jgi:hypothetical protein